MEDEGSDTDTNKTVKNMAASMLANYVDATNSVIATQSLSKYPNHHKIGQAMENGMAAVFAASRVIETKGSVNENSFLKLMMKAMNKEENADAGDRADSDTPPAWAQQLIDDNKVIKQKLKL